MGLAELVLFSRCQRAGATCNADDPRHAQLGNERKYISFHHWDFDRLEEG